ncbi:MAG: PAS domain S-box protein [bacterium]
MAAPSDITANVADIGLGLLDVVGCGIWIYDGTDTRYVNQALAEITGFTAEELLAPGFFSDLIHPEDREMIIRRGRARIAGEDEPQTYEIRILARSGDVRILALDAKRALLPSGPVSVVSAVDVTSLRSAEATIRAGSSLVVELLHSLPAHVITTDPGGKPTFVNKHWLKLTGQTEEEALAEGTAPLIHPDDREVATERWLTALRTGEGYEIDYRVRDAKGEFRWQNFRIRPLTGADGELVGWTSASVDIHEAKMLSSQLASLNEELVTAVHAKDEVLGLISHELRTPLTTVLGNARLLRRHGPTLSDADRNAVAADIESDAERLHGVIGNMLVLSRSNMQEALEAEPLRLELLAQEVIRDFSSRHPGRTVDFRAPNGLPLAQGNSTHFRQILENLLSNAHKYSPPHSPIGVRMSRAAGAIETEVTDEGPGLSDEDQAKVFEAFFRSSSHSTVYGIGLGLTVCRRLVELHGGCISARNRQPHGCAFTFTTPEFHEGIISES